MPSRLPTGALLAAAFATTLPATSAAQRPDSATFVARLGTDTLVVERMIRTPSGVQAEMLSRVPRTTLTRYGLTLSPAQAVERYEATTYAVGADGRASGAATRREVTVRNGDSLRVEVTGGAAPQRARTVAAPPATLPFVDLAHWPFDVALVRARAMSVAEPRQPMLTGGSVQEFPIGRVGADSMTITHPLRGTMRAKVDADGRLLGLDAAATTRKLIVERRPYVGDAELRRIAASWAARDSAGRSIGALSGRAQAEARVGAATVKLDYGTPSKRGRAVWGALVPYGQLWRTGANTATQLVTDRDLVLGAGADTLVVPAGQYSIFSIPTAEGGTLILSREADIAGTAYDATKDLGRVPLRARRLPAVVETFTIAVAPEGSASLLRIQWDDQERVVPLRAR